MKLWVGGLKALEFTARNHHVHGEVRRVYDRLRERRDGGAFGFVGDWKVPAPLCGLDLVPGGDGLVAGVGDRVSGVRWREG